MAHTKKYIEPIGEVRLYKRRGTRSIRIRLRDDGTVRVTLPFWSSYRAALTFVEQQSDWIMKQKTQRSPILDGSRIGDVHIVDYAVSKNNTQKLRTRVSSTKLTVYVPPTVSALDVAKSEQVHKAAVRALKRQAEGYLTERARFLAKEHDFAISDVRVKPMRSRWGSCSSVGVITLNVYLMQLPAEYRDYVIYHELVHTQVPNHSPAFWSRVAEFVPNIKEIKQIMKIMPTQVIPIAPPTIGQNNN